MVKFFSVLEMFYVILWERLHNCTFCKYNQIVYMNLLNLIMIRLNLKNTDLQHKLFLVMPFHGLFFTSDYLQFQSYEYGYKKRDRKRTDYSVVRTRLIMSSGSEILISSSQWDSACDWLFHLKMTATITISFFSHSDLDLWWGTLAFPVYGKPDIGKSSNQMGRTIQVQEKIWEFV